MPIKGLVDNITLREGFPCLGKLRKGAEQRPHPDPAKAAKGYKIMGQDLPYFRMTFEDKFADLAPVWEALYGAQPDQFDPVYVYGNDIGDAFTFFMEEWAGSTLMHRCDRETQELRYDKQIGRYLSSRVPCVQEATPPCACKPVGRLNLFLPDFVDACGVLGYITCETHSLNDIKEVYAVLNAIRHMTGSLNAVPLVFGRAPEEISAPKMQNGKPTGQRMRVTKSLFYLYANETYTRQVFLPALNSAAPVPLFAVQVQAPQLPAPPDPQAMRERLSPKPRVPFGREPLQDAVEGEIVGEPPPAGDAPEPDVIVPPPYNVNSLWDATQDLWNARKHYNNALSKYREFGVLRDDMTIVEAEAAVRLHRATEGSGEARIFADETMREKFIGACVGLLDSDAAIRAALATVATKYPFAALEDWHGDKQVAWAAVLAASCDYDVQPGDLPEQTGDVIRALVKLLCDRHASASEADAALAETDRAQEPAGEMPL